MATVANLVLVVLGEDRKLLVKPGMTRVEAPGGDDGTAESSPAQ